MAMLAGMIPRGPHASLIAKTRRPAVGLCVLHAQIVELRFTGHPLGCRPRDQIRFSATDMMPTLHLINCTAVAHARTEVKPVRIRVRFGFRVMDRVKV